MTTTPNHSNPDLDAFPGVIENPSDYRKGSGDYGVTFAVAVKHVGSIQPMMEKAQKTAAVFVVYTSSLDQAEAFIAAQAAKDSGALPLPASAGPAEAACHFATVEQMAAALGVDPRTVQLDADKGLVVRDGRGRYDTLASCATLRRAWKEAADGRNDVYNEERTRLIRTKRERAETEHQERLGRLVNAEAAGAAFQKVLVLINQKLNMAEKVLTPRLGLTPEQAQDLDEYIREVQTELAAPDIGGREDGETGKQTKATSTTEAQRHRGRQGGQGTRGNRVAAKAQKRKGKKL